MSHISIDCTRDEDFILNNKKNNKVDKHNNNLSNHPKYFTWCKCHIHLSNNNIYPDKCFMQCGLKPTETKNDIKNDIKNEKRKKIHYIYRACVILNINKRPIKKQKINHILK